MRNFHSHLSFTFKNFQETWQYTHHLPPPKPLPNLGPITCTSTITNLSGYDKRDETAKTGNLVKICIELVHTRCNGYPTVHFFWLFYPLAKLKTSQPQNLYVDSLVGSTVLYGAVQRFVSLSVNGCRRLDLHHVDLGSTRRRATAMQAYQRN